MAELTDEQFRQGLSYARRIGARHGREAVQDWLPAYLESAQSPSGLAREVLAELADVRLEIPAPLSGEWAGDYGMQDLVAGIARELELGLSVDLLWDDASEFADEYESAYREWWEYMAKQTCRDYMRGASCEN